MADIFDKRLSALDAQLSAPFADARRGVEKESLRVTRSGRLAQTPHPSCLGSALTNKYITTDFSEALLEFVTPVYPDVSAALSALQELHQFTYACLDDELLWPASMPCILAGREAIPLARYGRSNVGRMKTVYRRGLGYRYGRPMQTIAGVHYNYSVPADFWAPYQEIVGSDDPHFRSTHYLGLVRNFRRMGWMILYLFGASPALCKSFAGDQQLDMPLLGSGTYYQPYATSLRMSDLGYSNRNQSRIRISLNTLDEYVRDLTRAIHTPEPDYEKIGVVVDGRYRQLSANQLQIENEYYSPIRPKRVARSGERPTAALTRGGIEYIEVRSLDTSLYDPAGLSAETMRFVEAALVCCLLEHSPPFDDAILDETMQNQKKVALEGRDPDCVLRRRGEPVRLRDWGREILGKIRAVAEIIDGSADGDYGQAVASMQARMDDAALTPSARILAELNDRGCGFFDLALEQAQHHADYYAALPPMDAQTRQTLQDEAADSIRRQADIEAADDISFDKYLANYFASD